MGIVEVPVLVSNSRTWYLVSTRTKFVNLILSVCWRLVRTSTDLLLSKWLKEARNSLSCSCVMPLLSLVRIWFSTSLMVLQVGGSCKLLSQQIILYYRTEHFRAWLNAKSQPDIYIYIVDYYPDVFKIFKLFLKFLHSWVGSRYVVERLRSGTATLPKNHHETQKQLKI